MPSKILDLKNQVLGELTVLSDAILKPNKDGSNSSWFLCKCSCGLQKEIRGRSLKTGLTKSCGCSANIKHGHSRRNKGRPTPTYSSWISAKRRTKIKPGHKDYETYKNISMCSKWFNSFEAFLEDMGERPPGTTLDRYPNQKGNYEPGNCRWATIKQQLNNTAINKYIIFQGRTQTLQEWSEELNINASTLWRRIYELNWTITEAFTIPVRSQKSKKAL
jgi:hypothetical protein